MPRHCKSSLSWSYLHKPLIICPTVSLSPFSKALSALQTLGWVNHSSMIYFVFVLFGGVCMWGGVCVCVCMFMSMHVLGTVCASVYASVLLLGYFQSFSSLVPDRKCGFISLSPCCVHRKD